MRLANPLQGLPSLSSGIGFRLQCPRCDSWLKGEQAARRGRGRGADCFSTDGLVARKRVITEFLAEIKQGVEDAL
jgi:hypothetical protein